MNRPLRVLHLRDSPWVDGPGRTILETGSHLDRGRVEYHIGAFVSQPDAAHPLVEGALERGLNVIKIADSRGSIREVVAQVIEAIDHLGIDIIHASEFRSGMVAQICKVRRPVRVVATAHGWIANTPRRRLIRFMDKVLLRQFDRVILVSHAMRALVPRWWLPEERVQVLHNALVLRTYGSHVVDAPRRKVDLQGEITLLNVGRLSQEKGQELLLRAMHELSFSWPRLRLWFAGTGPLEQPLRGLAASLGLAERVEFLGYVKNMPELYSRIDLLVQTSFTEGLPNVILEGAYLRVPMVATAVGGTAEVVRHSHSAWLIRPRLEEVVAGVDAFLRNPTMFMQMAEQAHFNLIENFSFDVRTERLTQIYEALAVEPK